MPAARIVSGGRPGEGGVRGGGRSPAGSRPGHGDHAPVARRGRVRPALPEPCPSAGTARTPLHRHRLRRVRARGGPDPRDAGRRRVRGRSARLRRLRGHASRRGARGDRDAHRRVLRQARVLSHGAVEGSTRARSRDDPARGAAAPEDADRRDQREGPDRHDHAAPGVPVGRPRRRNDQHRPRRGGLCEGLGLVADAHDEPRQGPADGRALRAALRRGDTTGGRPSPSRPRSDRGRAEAVVVEATSEGWGPQEVVPRCG